MQFNFLIFTASLVHFCQSTQHSNGKRIVGGKDAVRGRYPAYGIPTGNVLCGATLIAPDLMLSAAHCKDAFTSGPSAVAIGGTKLKAEDAEEILGVAYEVPHPEYDPNTAANDIMLVKLDMPAKTAPVRVNDDPSHPIDGGKVFSIGFGNTEFKGNVSPTLQEVETNVVSHDICSSSYDKVKIHVDQDRMICTGVYGGGKGSCQGDSGGPIFSESDDGSLTLVATVSWGKGCASAVYPGVNMRMSSYLGFIEEAICQLSDYAPAYCESEVFYTPDWIANATFAPLPSADDDGDTVGLAAAYTNETDSWNVQSPDAAYDFAQVTASNVTETIFETSITTNATIDDLELESDILENNTTNSNTSTITYVPSLAPSEGNSTSPDSLLTDPSLLEGESVAFVNDTSFDGIDLTSSSETNETMILLFDDSNATEGNETSFIIESNATIDENGSYLGGNETSIVPSLSPSMVPTQHETFETLPQVEASSGRNFAQNITLLFIALSLIWR